MRFIGKGGRVASAAIIAAKALHYTGGKSLEEGNGATKM